MIVGVPKETYAGERRVALAPTVLQSLTGKGMEIVIEKGAGDEAGFPDATYTEKGAKIAGRDEVFSKADVLLQVRALAANPEGWSADLDAMRRDQVLIGNMEPYGGEEAVKKAAEAGVSSFAMELMPRISRAQTMDTLSSMATIAGYKAVLLAANKLPRMFPMMMTAAGTVAAARVFIIGAGVAGLQAIASARRLGAVVEAYDIRPAVKEQVESLGGKFVELPLETGESEDKGGYAKAMDEDFYRRQRELMGEVLSRSNVVITTAAVPGKKAPILITGDMVKGMAPRSVIVDLAAERGGNCELTRPGETAVEHGVTILGPLNLPSEVPYHASQMYAKNLTTFLLELAPEGEVKFDMDNQVLRDTMVSHGGKVTHAALREALGLPSGG